MVNTDRIDIEKSITDTLSEIFGSVVKAEAVETLRGSHRSKVMRYSLNSSSRNIPSTVIVKQALPLPGEIYDVSKA